MYLVEKMTQLKTSWLANFQKNHQRPGTFIKNSGVFLPTKAEAAGIK